MLYKQTTQVPNFLFDTYLCDLTEAELKVWLVIIRQTVGWVNKATGKRKCRDRITNGQFRQKSGLSKRVITKAIQSLSVKNLIQVTDFDGKELHQSLERKGKTYLYYSANTPAHITTPSSAQKIPEPVHKSDHNKTNYPKLKRTKLSPTFQGHISAILPKKETLLNFMEN